LDYLILRSPTSLEYDKKAHLTMAAFISNLSLCSGTTVLEG